MTETSFPVVEKPLTEDQWATIAHGFGQGVIDQGGFPYRIGTIDDVTDEVEILVDQLTGKNEAIVRGFVHSIDEPKRLHLPAVATETTYEIGIVYDPLNHGTEAGPVSLEVWTSPGDTTGGKVRIVLYRITRKPSTALSTATRVENRQRISPQIVVSGTADLPPTSAVLVDTVARVRTTGERWAATIDPDTGVIGWQKVDGGRDPDLVNATYEATGETLAKRHYSGSLRITTGAHDQDAVNIGWVWANATGGTVDAGGKLVRRGSDANFLIPSNPTHSQHPVPLTYSEGRYLRKGIDSLDGEQINKFGNDVWWEVISGSTSAYSNTNSTSTWATVGVTSGGRFFRYTSARRYKTNIEEWQPNVRELLKITPSRYQRINPETGEPFDRWEVGVIADDAVEIIPELGEYGPDSAEPEDLVGPAQQIKVQGWQYAQWTAALQATNRSQQADLDAIAEHLGIELPSMKGATS